MPNLSFFPNVEQYVNHATFRFQFVQFDGHHKTSGIQSQAAGDPTDNPVAPPPILNKPVSSKTTTIDVQTETTQKAVSTTTAKKPAPKDRKTSKEVAHTTSGSTNSPNKDICSFPSIDPFDEKILKFIKKYPKLNCTGGSPRIVDIVGYKIIVNYTKIQEKLNITKIDACRYRNVTMKSGTDFHVNYGNWSENFTESIRLREKEAIINAECYVGGKLVSKSYFPIVRIDKEVESRHHDSLMNHIKMIRPKEILNVLFVGIDGTSKQNLIRGMPKTRDFIVKSLGALEFNKYNKVGLNTLPNIIPLLTGLHEEEVRQNWSNSQPFDKIDHLFLWSDYKKAGYRTALLLDYVVVTAFHYGRHGWKKPPFDFYPRALAVSSQPDSVYRNKGRDCMGDTPEVAVLNDYWLQLATAFNNTPNTPSTPYFAYSFLSRIAHDDQNYLCTVDDDYLQFFMELKENNLLTNTIIVFFSDHGERFGDIR